MDRSGDVRGVADEHVVVLAMLGVGQFGVVCSRLSVRFLEAALNVLERDA